jgi:predicted ArsR family transcriptional regulator
VVTDNSQHDAEVRQFLLDQIDSVPHLEALLLLWNSRPKLWQADEMAGRLYVDREVALRLLQDLARQQLIDSDTSSPERYCYRDDPADRSRLIRMVDETYRREVVRVSTLIHSKPSSPVRDFARAFRFTKE